MRPRILIVDDNEAIRKALCRLLHAQDWEVCGEAADGPDAIDAVRRLDPDLVIMDLFMPTMSGIDAAREIRQQSPNMLIILMTPPDPEIEEAARHVGIGGVVSKGDGRIVAAVQTMLNGGERPV